MQVIHDWYNLPDGVGTWEPDKKGEYMIDVLPYEITGDNHPDEVVAGVVWFKHPFKVHHDFGSENKSVICPGTIGKKCPVCEEITRLNKDYDENEDLIKSLRPQRYVALNIVDPEDSDRVAIFSMPIWKFYDCLEKELAESDDDVANFFDVDESGKTLKVRFSEESFAGHKYLSASKIEFIERDEMDEDEVFDKVVSLDEMFVMRIEELEVNP